MGEAQFERLVHEIAPQAKLLRTWPLAGGLSAQMIAFEIEHAAGHREKMIVRQFSQSALKTHPRAVEEQFMLLQTTQASGLPTPKPIYRDVSGDIFGAPCLVMEYINGSMDFAPSNLHAGVDQFACQLTQIHSVPVSRYDFSFLFRRTHACGENAKQLFVQMNNVMQEGRIRAALSAVRPKSRANTAVLLHGDYWPGNVLWQDDKLVAVVDWEDATIGDPLIDLAISRLDVVWIFGIDAMHHFTHQYQSQMEIDYTHLPYWDLCAALRLIRLAGADLVAWVTFFEPYGRCDITTQTFLTKYHYFINQAFEKLACISQ